MKKILTLILVVVLGVSIVGCSKTQKTSKDTNGDVEIRFSWWGGDSRHEATFKALKLFEKENPNIKVKVENTGFTGHEEKISTQLTGGSEADLMQINYNWFYKFSSDGETFYDLSKLKNLQLENWPQEYLDMITINGKVQGVPVSVGGRLFFINEKLYKEAGAKIPTTWDELIEAGKKFKAKGKDKFALGNIDYDDDLPLIMFEYITQKTGKEVITEEGKFNFTKEELVDGFKFVTTLFENNVIPVQDFDSSDKDKENAHWIQGDYAGMFIWDSAIQKNVNNLQPELAESVKALGFLSQSGQKHSGVYTKPLMGFAISKNSEHPEEAAKLLNFLFTNKEAVKALNLERGVPINTVAKKILEEENLLNDLQSEGNTLVHANKDAYAIHPYYEATDVKLVYGDTMKEYAFGKMTPEAAADRILESIDTTIAEAMDQ